MKMFNTLILAAISVFAVSNSALAGTVKITGFDYGTTLTTDATVLPSGNTLVKQHTQVIMIVEGLPEGFPSMNSGSCQYMGLSSPEYANLGFTISCVVTDIDGDGYIFAGGDTNPDWSGCQVKSVAGWGKYAGTTLSSTCTFVGNVTADGNQWVAKWSADFTTPD